MPWIREWQTIPVFWPGRIPVFLHGQRRLAGESPWGCSVWHDWATSTFSFHATIKTWDSQIDKYFKKKKNRRQGGWEKNVFDFYDYRMNHHKYSNLNQHSWSSCSFCGSEVWAWVSQRSGNVELEVLARAVISPGVLPSLFRLLAESIPCFLDSLLSVDWGPSTWSWLGWHSQWRAEKLVEKQGTSYPTTRLDFV